MCIYICCIHGLCNRLSWLCGHYAYNLSRKCKEDCTVYVRWIPQRFCNGDYQEIFKDLPMMKWVKSDDEVPKGVKKYYGQHSVPNVFKMYNVKISSELECSVFGLLNFKDEIEREAKEFMDKKFSKNTIGFHVRRTDHTGLAKKVGNYKDDNYFFGIMEDEIKKDKDVRFYLACDNRVSQDLYLKKFPNHIIIKKEINKIKDSFRHTTLRDAGLDMCLLSHCSRVEGSFHSSFSRVALMLNLNRRGEQHLADKELNRYVFRGHQYHVN